MSSAEYFTIIPRARMGSESIAHEAEVSIRGQKLIHPITQLCPLNISDQP